MSKQAHDAYIDINRMGIRPDDTVEGGNPMAWMIAGYAAAIVLLAVAGCTAAATWQFFRLLRKWDRMAERLAVNADRAFDDYGILARDTRQLVEDCRRVIEGISWLAEGARSVGRAAEYAAQTAVSTVDAWRLRIASWKPAEENDETDGDMATLAWVEGFVARLLQRFVKTIRHPGTSADP